MNDQAKARDVKNDPSVRSGAISGIDLHIEYQPYKGSETTCWCYVVVSASTRDHDGGDIILIRELLGIYEGDNRPTASHWTSTPGGIATGKWRGWFDSVVPHPMPKTWPIRDQGTEPKL